MAKWYNQVEEAGFHSFNVIASTFYEHYDDILNFYNNRSSNAAAESFNSKIKGFMCIPADTRSPIPVIPVHSVGNLQYMWQS